MADSIKEQKKKMNDLSKPSVLIVDDASANIDVVLGVLQSEYEMIVALDGPTALKIVESNKPDIILLDIMMPEMDGYEVCKRLKADDATKDIPVIFITGLTDEENTGKGLELGAVDYITKPFNSSEVIGKVKKYIPKI